MSQNNPLTAILDAQPFILLDGAMATELEARGCNLSRRCAGGDYRQLSGYSGGVCRPRAG